MIHDEVYGDYIVNQDIIPFIRTDHPESNEMIGWTHSYLNSKIVYLQPGHDHFAFENGNYRLLLQQAIHYVISK